MKRLLVVVAVLLAGVAGVGFYRGWFSVSTADADHKSNVTFTVDQDKMRDDGKKLKDMKPGGATTPAKDRE
jgi:hypothetical protein